MWAVRLLTSLAVTDTLIVQQRGVWAYAMKWYNVVPILSHNTVWIAYYTVFHFPPLREIWCSCSQDSLYTLKRAAHTSFCSRSSCDYLYFNNQTLLWVIFCISMLCKDTFKFVFKVPFTTTDKFAPHCSHLFIQLLYTWTHNKPDQVQIHCRMLNVVKIDRIKGYSYILFFIFILFFEFVFVFFFQENILIFPHIWFSHSARIKHLCSRSGVLKMLTWFLLICDYLGLQRPMKSLQGVNECVFCLYVCQKREWGYVTCMGFNFSVWCANTTHQSLLSFYGAFY